MYFWLPVLAALFSQLLTALTLAYTTSDSILRFPISVCVAGLTWLFHQTLQHALENRLYLALLSTVMWIQCIKTFDDLCLTKISVEAQLAGRAPARQNGVEASSKKKPFQMSASPKISWALAMLWNARGVGTPWETSKIPPWCGTRPGLVPSRRHEIRRHAQAFVVSYLVLDAFANLPPPDVDTEMSTDRQLLLTRLGKVSAAEALFRGPAVLGFWANTFCAIHLINSACALAQLALGLQPVEMLPPVWGRLSEAHSVRNFWGTTWHQTLRRPLTSVSEYLVHSVLGLRRGSLVARYAKLVLCFCVSGALHRSADVMLGVPPGESRALQYFATTALVIMLEDAVQHLLGANTGECAWGKRGGYLWVCFAMYWMTPSWAYPAARAARPDQDVLVPYSVVGGLIELFA